MSAVRVGSPLALVVGASAAAALLWPGWCWAGGAASRLHLAPEEGEAGAARWAVRLLRPGAVLCLLHAVVALLLSANAIYYRDSAARWAVLGVAVVWYLAALLQAPILSAELSGVFGPVPDSPWVSARNTVRRSAALALGRPVHLILLSVALAAILLLLAITVAPLLLLAGGTAAMILRTAAVRLLAEYDVLKPVSVALPVSPDEFRIPTASN